MDGCVSTTAAQWLLSSSSRHQAICYPCWNTMEAQSKDQASGLLPLRLVEQVLGEKKELCQGWMALDILLLLIKPTKTRGIPGNWTKAFLTAVYHSLLLKKWDGLCLEKNGLLFASSQQKCNHQHIEKVSYVKCSALRCKAWSLYIV